MCSCVRKANKVDLGRSGTFSYRSSKACKQLFHIKVYYLYVGCVDLWEVACSQEMRDFFHWRKISIIVSRAECKESKSSRSVWTKGRDGTCQVRIKEICRT